MSDAARDAAKDVVSTAAVDTGRRNWIAITCGAGAIGGVATAVPFVSTFAPSERARAAGAPVQVDISGVKPGEKLTVEWRGKPVWIVRRTPEQLASLKKTDALVADPKSDRTQYPTPAYAKNETRAIKPEWLVVVGICSHLGCSPSDKFTTGPQPFSTPAAMADATTNSGKPSMSAGASSMNHARSSASRFWLNCVPSTANRDFTAVSRAEAAPSNAAPARTNIR